MVIVDYYLRSKYICYKLALMAWCNSLIYLLWRELLLLRWVSAPVGVWQSLSAIRPQEPFLQGVMLSDDKLYSISQSRCFSVMVKYVNLSDGSGGGNPYANFTWPVPLWLCVLSLALIWKFVVQNASCSYFISFNINNPLLAIYIYLNAEFRLWRTAPSALFSMRFSRHG